MTIAISTTTQRRLTLEEYLTYNDGTDTHYEFDDGILVRVLKTDDEIIKKSVTNIGLGTERVIASASQFERTEDDELSTLLLDAKIYQVLLDLLICPNDGL
jgi:hypothetical protein